MIESRQALDRRGFLGRTLQVLVISCGIGLGLSQPASAQFAFEEAILPPRVVAWRLADRGFSGMTRPRFDGRVYVVDAVNPAGVPVRLFVDPMEGAIVGRQRLGVPETYARLERPAPGFGWTEEDAGPRRGPRALPPGDASGPAPRPVRRPAVEAARPDANPDVINPNGLNPDGATRPEAPRKFARAVQPSRQPELKPALRTTPEAPAPKLAPSEAARPAEKPDAPAAAIKQEPAPAGTAPSTDDRGKPAAGARADAAKPAQDWKDPPVEGRKPVRVIGGATVVPGTADGKELAKDAGQ